MIFRGNEALPVLINIGLIVVGVPIVTWLTGMKELGREGSYLSYQLEIIEVIILIIIQPSIFAIARIIRESSLKRQRGGAR